MNFKNENDDFASDDRDRISNIDANEEPDENTPNDKNSFFAVNHIVRDGVIDPERCSVISGADGWKYFLRKIKEEYEKSKGENEEIFKIIDHEAFFNILNSNLELQDTELTKTIAEIIGFFINCFPSNIWDIISLSKENIELELSQIILSEFIANNPGLSDDFIDIAQHLKGPYFIKAINALINEGIDIPNHIEIIKSLIETNDYSVLPIITALTPTFEELQHTESINFAFSFIEGEQKPNKEISQAVCEFLYHAFRHEGGVCNEEEYERLIYIYNQGTFDSKHEIAKLLARLIDKENIEIVNGMLDKELLEMCVDTIEGLSDSPSYELKSNMKLIYAIIKKIPDVLPQLSENNSDCFDTFVSSMDDIVEFDISDKEFVELINLVKSSIDKTLQTS